MCSVLTIRQFGINWWWPVIEDFWSVDGRGERVFLPNTFNLGFFPLDAVDLKCCLFAAVSAAPGVLT